MRVKVLVLTIASMVVLTLAACSDQQAAKTEEKNATATTEQGVPGQPAQEQAAAPATDEVLVAGIVDAEGKVTDENGQAYTIADNDMGKEVLKLADKKVELKGTVSEKEGAKTITVTEYKEIE